ncbi:MAG: NAD-dependent epimerase/dehydratase family protein [Planctomycetes bacterium]|nr:NAD-dependent epimerase/dehydratase family protein [Planctomycetota bacterium]
MTNSAPVLVTGGGGFLGSHIVKKLLARGGTVRVLGRRDYPALSALGVDCFRGDVADSGAVGNAVSGCQGVIHAAAVPGIWGEYQAYYRTNYLGTKNIVAAALAHGVSRLVYTSTPSVVHGGSDIEGGDEGLPYAKRYLTAYAATKALAEKLVLRQDPAQLAVAAIRPHLMFGPGDTQLIPKIIARAQTNRLRRIGAGRNLVSVGYVENVADAHLLALDKLGPGSRIAGQVYFVNEPEPVNCWDFINRILTGIGLCPVGKGISYPVAYAAGWLCEIFFSLLRQKQDPPLTRFLADQLATSHWFKVDKALCELGWQPRVELWAGVENTLAWLREKKDSPPSPE